MLAFWIRAAYPYHFTAVAPTRSLNQEGKLSGLPAVLVPYQTTARLPAVPAAAHGKTDVGLPPGPPFFRFSDPVECQRVLVEAGFVEPRVEQVPMAWRLPSAEHFFQAMLDGTVRTRGVLRAQTPEALSAIRAAAVEEASAYRQGDAVAIPAPAVLASAVKP